MMQQIGDRAFLLADLSDDGGMPIQAVKLI
jgi:hypothetical protein